MKEKQHAKKMIVSVAECNSVKMIVEIWETSKKLWSFFFVFLMCRVCMWKKSGARLYAVCSY